MLSSWVKISVGGIWWIKIHETERQFTIDLEMKGEHIYNDSRQEMVEVLKNQTRCYTIIVISCKQIYLHLKTLASLDILVFIILCNLDTEIGIFRVSADESYITSG